MAELHWAILCHRGIVDRFSNVLSIIEVVNEINLAKMNHESPDESQEASGMAINCHLVTLWSRSDPDEPEEFWQRVTITTPDGEEHSAPGDRLLGDLLDHKRTRLLTGIRVIPYRGSGMYFFNVLCAEDKGAGGELAGRVPVEVKVTEGSSAD